MELDRGIGRSGRCGGCITVLFDWPLSGRHARMVAPCPSLRREIVSALNSRLRSCLRQGSAACSAPLLPARHITFWYHSHL